MNIHVHIERLILDGIPVDYGQRPALQAAVEAELVSLLSENGVAPCLQAGGAIPSMSGGTIQLSHQDAPAQLGRQIGQAVYKGISR